MRIFNLLEFFIKLDGIILHKQHTMHNTAFMNIAADKWFITVVTSPTYGQDPGQHNRHASYFY